MAKFKSPYYPNAPLVEVALSVQFQPLQKFTSAHVGYFWNKIRKDFAIVQEHSTLPPVNEFFGSPRPILPQFGVGLQFGFPGIRHWFLDAEGIYLIQIQNNRFIFNWRKLQSNKPYPRYEVLRKKFSKYLNLFKSFVAQQDLGQVSFELFEAHYVNQWPLQDGKSFGEVIGGWLKLVPSQVTSLEFEQANISSQFLVKGDSGQPVGRLHVNVVPTLSQQGQYGVSLDLICRIVPFDLNASRELLPLDLAREKIVTTFQQITSDSAQEFWRGE